MAKVPGTNDGEIPEAPQRRQAERHKGRAPASPAQPSPKPAGDAPARTSLYERLRHNWGKGRKRSSAEAPVPAMDEAEPVRESRAVIARAPGKGAFYGRLVGGWRERSGGAAPQVLTTHRGQGRATPAAKKPLTMAERQQQRHAAKVDRFNAGVEAVAEQQRRNTAAAAAAPEPPAMPAGAAPTEEVTAVVSGGGAAPAESPTS